MWLAAVIEKHYYDPAFGIDLAARFGAAGDRIEKAATLNEVYAFLTDPALARAITAAGGSRSLIVVGVRSCVATFCTI